MAKVQSGFSKFPWKLKAENCKELVEDFLKAYQNMGRNSFFICT
jgi:hypothetical protein